MSTIENNEVAFLSRKLLEINKQLMESERAKSHFLSLIASELNNPMTALLGMIPHLMPPSGDPREGIFALAHEEALLLESRIENLVAAAEIESGMVDVTYATVDPETLIDEVTAGFKYKLKRKNLIINVENALEGKIVSDPKKLYLILKNVIANACDYGESDATVTITIATVDTNVVFAIKNQGKAPNVEFKPQIFTRFAHGMEGLHGLGLGLSIAREFCERMEGNIDYDTDSSSVTFSITLPIQTHQACSDACGSNEFLFESFEGAIEL